jgi:hypothetical protein
MNACKRFGRFIVDPRANQLANGSGYSAEFSIQEHNGVGVTDTIFYLPGVFPTKDSAIAAAIESGRVTIGRGFQPSR